MVRILPGVIAILGLLTACGEQPKPDNPATIVYLDQGWTETDRLNYYYTPQGTQLFKVRYEWLKHMELPFSEQRFASPENLRRYGFLVEDDPQTNPDGFAVGFTRHTDQETGEEFFDVSCATCHTGQINYRGVGIRIDGGSALHSYIDFGVGIASSLAATSASGMKFDRFAKKVLGDAYPAGRDELRKEVWETVKGIAGWGFYGWWHDLYPVDEGFGRLDAVARIGNTVFGEELTASNYHTGNAPVSLPFLWDIWRFDWVQYTASSQQPMARNISEALGVRAPVALVGSDGKPLTEAERFTSAVLPQEMHCIESTLWKLKAPEWPADILGAINQDRAARGRGLYDEMCVGCHGPHALPADEDVAVGRPGGWRVIPISTEEIGTDPNAADNWVDNMFTAEPIDPTNSALKAPMNAGTGLSIVAGAVAEKIYDDLGLTQSERNELNGFSIPNDSQTIRVYKARPLDGVWATPPYLHNGSVPNIYELLSPVEYRSKIFYTGSHDYDPVMLGYDSGEFDGGFKMDTSISGNTNTGHEFLADGKGPGIIGRALSEQEKWDLIEYIKILGAGAEYPMVEKAPQCDLPYAGARLRGTAS